MFEDVNTEFLREQYIDTGKTSKTYEELIARYMEILNDIAHTVKTDENPEGEITPEEAIEDAQSSIFIELKAELQSPAVNFVGIYYGSTAPFDWTGKIRAEALDHFKKEGISAIDKYVVKDKVSGEIKPLWFNSKDESKRKNILEPSNIRTFCGIAMKREYYSEIAYINDFLAGTTTEEQPDGSVTEKVYDIKKEKIESYQSMDETELKNSVAKLWLNYRWFDLTVSNKYADPNAPEFLKEPVEFGCVTFKALDKTDYTKNNTLVLGCSSLTVFEPSDKLMFKPESLKKSVRHLDIDKLETPFALSANYSNSVTEKGASQTTNNIYITEGTVSGELASSPFSDIIRLDDMKLGIDDPTRTVSLFMPKGKTDFGKKSKGIFLGKLTRKWDANKKAWNYPGIQVVSWVITKMVKPVKEDNVKENMKEVNINIPTPEPPNIQPSEKTTTSIQTDNGQNPDDTNGSVPLPKEETPADSWNM